MGLMAGGVAAVGLGVASTLVSRHKFDAINQDAAANRPYNEANGNWKTYDRMAAVLYVVGAGALVSGIVVYTTAPGREQERAAVARPRSIALRPVIAPERVGAALTMRF
jgi:hypothetical protein